MLLENKVALVTGAARGIGREIALRFAKEGADLALADICRPFPGFPDYQPATETELNQTCRDVTNLGRQAIAIKADVTSWPEVEAMVKQTLDKFGKIDILVNNAGVIFPHLQAFPVSDLPEDEWDLTLACNLKSAFLCSKAVAKLMMEKQSGKIVNIASLAGKLGYGMLSAYCTSKWGMVGLTKTLALELAPYNVQVNAVCPGMSEPTYIERTLWESYAKTLGLTADDMKTASLVTNPTAFIGTEAKQVPIEQVAALAAFLASPEADYITAQTVIITGTQVPGIYI